ncbi:MULTISPECIES: DUF6204 family protein [Streptomyces]|uniref:Uncharacterized protein n=2 Tax=Streptomyces TaxID=1883 RepID=A0AA89TZ29_STRCU|nr:MULTISPECIES: DUF6204 family protein [Streptomyces]MBB5813433.1 hypothetical protein [Streptomyces collinus]MEC7056312.1 DUF6204 family protein [Streptomyces violaceochromogenes]WMX66522.1 DUF6204 family protein [Streptomyces collinus]
MSTRTFRVTVRGVFDGLSADQRAGLLARAAEHDVLRAAFTPEGSLTYDVAVRPAFTFRFLDSGEAEEDILEATERAEESARAWLEQRGYGYKNLRSTAEDLSQAPLGKRQRREAARKGCELLAADCA